MSCIAQIRDSRYMMVVIFVFLLAIPIFLFFVLQKHRKHVVQNLPPGPPGLPIIGNIHQLDSDCLHSCLWELSKKHGPLMSLRLGFVPTIVISSARVAREVLKTHDLVFASRPPMVGWRKLSYDGLDVAFSPYNDYWREMRKVCAVHLFNSKTVQSFHPIRSDETSRMIAKISKDAGSSKITNLSDLAISLTSDIICRVAFGKRYEEEGKENKRLHKLVKETQVIMGGFFFQEFFPYMGWLDSLRGMHTQLHNTFMDLDAFYQEIIDDHLDHSQRPKSGVEDLIDILLEIKRDRLFSRELTWDHIKGVLMNVFLAGIDTSAVTIVWAMTMLMKNPRVLEKVQEEIRAKAGNKGVVHEDDIQKLAYFNAVVKETMRMHPPLPLLIPREAHEHCIIDGYDIAPKTLVYVNAWAIGRDPEAWENPNEFYPERFLGKSIEFIGQDYEFVPFGSGRRSCPGIHLANATLEVALSNLLYSFDWELPPGVKGEDIDLTTVSGLVMNKKNPLCLQAKNYNWK